MSRSVREAANAMRIICQKNGGTTFVGLHEVERRGPKFRVGGTQAVNTTSTALM